MGPENLIRLYVTGASNLVSPKWARVDGQPVNHENSLRNLLLTPLDTVADL